MAQRPTPNQLSLECLIPLEPPTILPKLLISTQDIVNKNDIALILSGNHLSSLKPLNKHLTPIFKIQKISLK